MPTLRITYGDLELFNGEVDTLHWDDSPDSVTVTGRAKPKPATAGLLDMLANGRRQQTQNIAARHRQELAADTAKDAE